MKMFREPMEFVHSNTDNAGRLRHGTEWPSMDWVSMLLFNATLIKMSLSVQSNIKTYFAREQPMRRSKFEKLYYNLKMYNIDDSNATGVNNKANAEKYDSLWKCREMWNKSIVNFQNMRNPPQQLSLDESMAKYTVNETSTITQVSNKYIVKIIKGRCAFTVVIKRKPGVSCANAVPALKITCVTTLF